MSTERDADESAHIAVIGMACRFPMADDPTQYWRNLTDGVDAITRLAKRPVAGANGSGAEYVPARGLIKDPEWFDAGYFGYSPLEARIISPQHRVFMECAVEALEDAGHDPERHHGAIALFAGAGSGDSTYTEIIRSRKASLPSVTDWDIRLATRADFLGTRVAYKLGLRGPTITVQAACATSLVAVHLAIQALLAGDCDLALAGGVSVHVPPKIGRYTEGGISSPNGICRAFDAAADGIVGGDGAGIVVLKRLSEALADGDHIHAVVRGTAVNNDGSDRIGYTAPSVDGQAAAIRDAQLVAQVDPDTITYVEAHGTATPLGDLIELAGLTKAFRRGTGGRQGVCLIGSVKTSIGHTDAAAGVAGLIKTVLAIEHGLVPPSLHFSEPNAQFDLDISPFRVATKLQEWRPDDMPRRAGVSAFGMGGTNAHAILEEPPRRERAAQFRPEQLIVLSARTSAALDAVTARLAGHLRAHPELRVADVAWTLQVGRKELAHRRFAVVAGHEDALAALAEDNGRLVTADGRPRRRRVAFGFPGRAAAERFSELADVEPEFRRRYNECFEEASSGASEDVLAGARDNAATFAGEYALARLLMAWGIRPAAVAGHGIGTLVAAAIVGVLPLRDAVRLALDWPDSREIEEPAEPAEIRLVTMPGADPERVLSALLSEPGQILVEVGAGHSMTDLARRLPEYTDGHLVVPTLTEGTSILSALGRLWLAGTPVAWAAVHAGECPVRVSLPTYPFERARYVIEPDESYASGSTSLNLTAAERAVPPGTGAERPSVHSGASAYEGGNRAPTIDVVTSLFAEMLGLDELDLDDSFFDLGGDSLIATRLLVQARKIFPLELGLRTMFEAPTAAEFAALIDRQLAERPGAPTTPLSEER